MTFMNANAIKKFMPITKYCRVSEFRKDIRYFKLIVQKYQKQLLHAGRTELVYSDCKDYLTILLNLFT